MSFTGDGNARPPRVTFTALNTLETVEMPFVPEELQEEVGANYAQQQIIGLSHTVDQYVNTTNHRFPGLDLFFRATSEDEAAKIHDARRFLLSVCYAEASDSVREGGPSRVLFFWPQLVSMTCVLKRLRIRHQKFNREGLPTIFRASVDLEEIRDFRLTASEVRVFGTQRLNIPPEGV